MPGPQNRVVNNGSGCN